MNFFKKIFSKEKADELTGIWQTTNEGGFHIMMGSELILHADGTGSEYSWGSDGDGEPYEYKNEIVWYRKSVNEIYIKNKEDPEFATVKYRLENYDGAYNIRYNMLYEPDHTMEKWELQGFWSIPGALYRKK